MCVCACVQKNQTANMKAVRARLVPKHKIRDVKAKTQL